MDAQGLDNININYRQGRQGPRRRRRRSRCDDQLSISSFASAESTGTDIVAPIVRTPLPKHTDFSTLLARWHEVAQRLGRERETEVEKKTLWSGSQLGPCCAEPELRLELDSDSRGRQSRLKVSIIPDLLNTIFCFSLTSISKGGLVLGSCFDFPALAAQSETRPDQI